MSTAESADARSVLNKAMTERELQQAVEELLDRFGYLWFHRSDRQDALAAAQGKHHVMSKGKGFFDIVALRGCELLLIELKTEKGKLSTEQKMWRQEAREIEGRTPYVRYLLWRPADLSQGRIEAALR